MLSKKCVSNADSRVCSLACDVSFGYKSELASTSTSIRIPRFDKQSSCCEVFKWKLKMYTNPFSRTHSNVRQIIDRFFHINGNKKTSNKRGLRRNSFSTTSISSDKSSSSFVSSCSTESSKRLISMTYWVPRRAN